MLLALSALLISSLLSDVKTEMASQYPSFERQIQQVGLPSIGYRDRLMLNWRHGRFQAGRCDLFAKPQVLVVRDKNPVVTNYRLRHELEHYVAFAAGLSDREHGRIDQQ